MRTKVGQDVREGYSCRLPCMHFINVTVCCYEWMFVEMVTTRRHLTHDSWLLASAARQPPRNPKPYHVWNYRSDSSIDDSSKCRGSGECLPRFIAILRTSNSSLDLRLLPQNGYLTLTKNWGFLAFYFAESVFEQDGHRSTYTVNQQTECSLDKNNRQNLMWDLVWDKPIGVLNACVFLSSVLIRCSYRSHLSQPHNWEPLAILDLVLGDLRTTSQDLKLTLRNSSYDWYCTVI